MWPRRPCETGRSSQDRRANSCENDPDRVRLDRRRGVAKYPYFTKPRDLLDYSSCVIHETGTSVKPLESSSVFNFFRPGYNPPATTLGLLGLTGPELQVTTITSQIVWLNAISALCETRKVYNVSNGIPSTAATNALLDPRGNTAIYGFDFLCISASLP